VDNYNCCAVWDHTCSSTKLDPIPIISCIIPTLKLNDSVSKIPLIGPKYEALLLQLGAKTVQDLLYYFPRTYFDSSKVHEITDLDREEKKTFVATVLKFSSIRTRKKRMTIQSALVEDDSAQIDIMWFNQPFLKDSLKVGEKYIFSGKLNPKSYKPQVSSPEHEPIKESQTHVGLITPIYPLTQGLSNKWLRSRIKWLIDKLDYVTDLEETLPKKITTKYKLTNLFEALRAIHFPETQKELKAAETRLGFEELLEIQVKMLKRKKSIEQLTGPSINPDRTLIKEFISKLDFELTQGQTKAIDELADDLSDKKPMNRLLSGDVGSGKTIIAIAASLLTVKSSKQVAILVPTTVLADQHYQTFTQTLQDYDIKISQVSSNKNIEADTKNADIIIGTHALLHQKKELFSNLGLTIIDEQHKFGVEQREDLRKTFTNKTKKNAPHFLTMTATPIPRTLALTLFGDLEVSELKEKPSSRKPVKTHLVPENKREDALKWIEKKAKTGIQIFWIAPLIEESEKLQVKSVKTLFKELQESLPDLNVKLLHGKIKPKEKQKTLDDFSNFKDEKIHTLVSTSVIEVGIDIPNANIIVIEGAERFGLAQLHQLRGRVGRSEKQAWCFLFTSTKPTSDQRKRLRYFAKENDGFNLAEFDLQRRGPGEVYGTRQAGIPDLKIASIFDMELVKKTREAALEMS